MANTREADVVVVGSGIAGALVAYRLAQKGLKVTMLEAGPLIDRSQALMTFIDAPIKHNQSPFPVEKHALHPGLDFNSEPYVIEKGPHKYNALYLRVVGGTTWHWAGESWRFLPHDFKLKSTYGRGRDWPLSYQELEPYYGQAEVEIGVSGVLDLGSPRSQPYPLAGIPPTYMDQVFKKLLKPIGYDVVVTPAARNSRGYDSRPVCCGSHNCMPLCPIGAQYAADVHVQKAIKSGVELIHNAVVYDIEVDQTQKVQAVSYKDPQGRSHQVKGKRFVIAAHGIETPKLLLISRSERTPNGVANTSDQVGRNLMDHPGYNVEFTMPEPVYPGRGPQSVCSIVDLRDGAFRRDYGSIKIGVWNGLSVSGPAQALINQGLTGKILEQTLRDYTARRCLFSSFHEQLPDPLNRVTQSALKDPLGIPRPEIYYSVDSYTHKSVEKVKQIFTSMVQHLKATDAVFPQTTTPNNHIMGTTIMGDDPKNSVVDRHCRTHDHKNLYIAGSSVFASSAAVNSTLTIAALSLKIADHIEAHFTKF